MDLIHDRANAAVKNYNVKSLCLNITGLSEKQLDFNTKQQDKQLTNVQQIKLEPNLRDLHDEDIEAGGFVVKREPDLSSNLHTCDSDIVQHQLTRELDVQCEQDAEHCIRGESSYYRLDNLMFKESICSLLSLSTCGGVTT
jgi:hypothetical protein